MQPGAVKTGAVKTGAVEISSAETGPVKIILHTGKGGVGKTTVSAITALRTAAAGNRTLLLSTDPAHSVGDVLGVPVGAEPTPVIAGLWAAQVDTRSRFEAGWSVLRDYLVTLLANRGMADVQAEELTVLPGADEVVALLEVRRWAASGQFDVLVVDCAPSGDTLRVLALPETVTFYLERIMGTGQRLLRLLAGVRSKAPADPPVRDALADLLTELTAARTLLSDPDVTRIRLVLTGERVVMAEARRLHTALSLHGYAVDAVVVNRLLPKGAGGAFLAPRRAAEAAAIAVINESFAGLRVLTVPMTPVEPVGVEDLQALGEKAFGDQDLLAVPDPGPVLTVSGGRGDYRLRLALPQVDRAEVGLLRSGDELVVTVAGHRRRIALPSLLQRCRTTGARFDADVLEIAFEPDPDRWPAALADPLVAGPGGDGGPVSPSHRPAGPVPARRRSGAAAKRATAR